MNQTFRFAAVAACSAMLCACGAARPTGFTAALPPPPVASAAVQPANGAIFQSANGYAPLHYGQRARSVGDPVTVVLAERTTTAKSASGKTSRDGSLSLTPPSVGPFSFNPNILNSGASGSFNGKGDAAQASSLSGAITVTIAEVLPGGIARIRGEKIMDLSQGQEWIQLTGIIRLADISSDNQILSTRIADAQIAYSGKGSVQRSAREGWLSKFFSMVSPF
ncbi:flagellar biosynthesis protein FlgH [Porphyrobacter algicida]|uniref:Flagellar L-ring protein n=1 Tax=Qipengyuania algicida TaxID=1836209 RepID=A0A845ADZ9_9SPHN|nr:flagellar basal body L-ring protein FlgH [Qipengyuania algicida]MXP27619.1 flagellar biosynthesis protein FlgH [Qipengyuania algicida]